MVPGYKVTKGCSWRSPSGFRWFQAVKLAQRQGARARLPALSLLQRTVPWQGPQESLFGLKSQTKWVVALSIPIRPCLGLESRGRVAAVTEAFRAHTYACRPCMFVHFLTGLLGVFSRWIRLALHPVFHMHMVGAELRICWMLRQCRSSNRASSVLVVAGMVIVC
jgi:hypothetical protein